MLLKNKKLFKKRKSKQNNSEKPLKFTPGTENILQTINNGYLRKGCDFFTRLAKTRNITFEI